MLTIKALIPEIEVMLRALRVPYQKVPLEANLPPVFLISTFGVIVAGLEPLEYSIISNRINTKYPGFRFVPITVNDNLLKAKDIVLWELMRGGYMRFIRQGYPAQFKTLIFEYGLGRKIINERLRIWNGQAKFKYLIEENERVLATTDQYTLAVDPAFYDYMPEEVAQHGE